MNYQDIAKCLSLCEDHINEGGGKITSVVLSSFPMPENIKNLIKQDYKMFKKIIDFYYHDFQIKLADSTDLLEVLKSIDFIQNKTNSKKTLVMDFSNEILPWLKSGQFFIKRIGA